MDAIRLLKADHKTVKGLFRQFEEAGDRAYQTKQRIAEQAMQELEVHTTIEEELFYPALDAKADKDGKKLVDEAVEEHHVVKVLIGELKTLAPEADQYPAKFTVLTENVEHHIEEEEGELFPDAEQRLKGELDELGERMQRRKEQLITALASARAGRAGSPVSGRHGDGGDARTVGRGPTRATSKNTR